MSSDQIMQFFSLTFYYRIYLVVLILRCMMQENCIYLDTNSNNCFLLAVAFRLISYTSN